MSSFRYSFRFYYWALVLAATVAAQPSAPIVFREHLAGWDGGDGMRDGIGDEARFTVIKDITFASDGNFYLSDERRYSIRQLTPTGRVRTVFGPAWELAGPSSLARDDAGNFYVELFNTKIAKVQSDGTTTILAGSNKQGARNGQGEEAQFEDIFDILANPDGTLLVADNYNRTIRQISTSGYVTTYAGKFGESDLQDGARLDARFLGPKSMVRAADGTLFVLDAGNYVRRIDPQGNVTTLPKNYEVEYTLHLIALTPTGTILLASNSSIYSLDENFQLELWSGGLDVTDRLASRRESLRLSHIQAIAADAVGNVFVSDSQVDLIYRIAPDGTVTNFAGKPFLPIDPSYPEGLAPSSNGHNDGTRNEALFNQPQGLAQDTKGDLYVADTENHVIRRVTPTGIVSTWAGVPGESGFRNGEGVQALFNFPTGVAFDLAGNLLVTDKGNHVIRSISTEGQVKTYAGAVGNSVSWDGPISTARFNEPDSISTSPDGWIYLTETSLGFVRRISPSGQVQTYLNSLSFGATQTESDGGKILGPYSSITIAPDGNLYVSTGNRINRIDLDGMLTTFFSGGALRLGQRAVIAADEQSRVWVGGFNGTLWRVEPDGEFVELFSRVEGPPLGVGYEDGYNGRAQILSGISIGPSGKIHLTSRSSNGVMHLTARESNSAAKLVNLSVLSIAGSNDDTLTLGYVLTGTGTKPMLARAVGPTLADYGVADGFLVDPELHLFGSDGALMDTNNDWGGGTALRESYSAVGAFSFSNESLDAALLSPLGPGAFTAQATAHAGTASGTALVEVYDTDISSSPHLVNLSALKHLSTNAPSITAGFVVHGTSSKSFLIRAVGPSLTDYGVPESRVLSDPVLSIFDPEKQIEIARNDNWGGVPIYRDLFTELGAFPFPDPISRDAALLVTLSPGAYTVRVSDAMNNAGTTLVEIYEIP